MKNILCHMVDRCSLPQPIPKSITERDEVVLQADKQHSSSRAEGKCGAADSLAIGHSGLRRSCLTLVPLFGVLLTVHHIPNPKVTPHHEVKTTICAGVAL